jgi:hypothetical protein
LYAGVFWDEIEALGGTRSPKQAIEAINVIRSFWYKDSPVSFNRKQLKKGLSKRPQKQRNMSEILTNRNFGGITLEKERNVEPRENLIVGTV